MSESADRLARAERAASEARARLGATLEEIQHQLSPSNLMNQAMEEAQVRGRALLEQAGTAILSRPFATTLIASALGLFFKRKPWLNLLVNLLMPKRATWRGPKHSTVTKRKRTTKAVRSAHAAEETMTS